MEGLQALLRIVWLVWLLALAGLLWDRSANMLQPSTCNTVDRILTDQRCLDRRWTW